MSANNHHLAEDSIDENAVSVPTQSTRQFSWRRVILSITGILAILIPAIILLELNGISLFEPGQPLGRSAALAQGSGGRGIAAFDLSNTTIPRNEILGGGPPKDGIPAISRPGFLPAKNAAYLGPNDRVIGVSIGTEARAYPLKILNYHEIVNDRVGEVPIAVTYCPLCDSAAVFDRRTPLGEREFGVSGLLYNSNVLMYDRANDAESLWSQIRAKGVSGPGAQVELSSLPLELTSWSDWTRRYPESQVLSTETGHSRDYGRSPYGGYFQTPQLMFPAKPSSDRLPAKERVLGIWSGKTFRAYPESSFSPENTRMEDQIDGKRIVVEFVPGANSLRVAEADEGIQWMYSLWFAWYAMHPTTEVFQPDQ